MGYKQIDQNMTFAEASLLKSMEPMEHNRSLKRLEKINQPANDRLVAGGRASDGSLYRRKQP
jgi:hypothetical protein